MVENEDAQGKVVDVVSNGASASDPAHGLVYRLIHAVIGQVDRGEIKL